MKTKISDLKVSPFNVRNVSDIIQQEMGGDFEKSIELLAEDIQHHGLINKIVLAKGDSGSLEIVAGSRRTKALEKIHGPDYLLAADEYIVRDLSSLESLKISISENQQRYDLTALELCSAIRKLNEVSPGYSEEELSKILCISVLKLKRIAELSLDIEKGKVPEKALKELNKKSDEKPALTDKHWKKIREETPEVIDQVVDTVINNDVAPSDVDKVVKKTRQKVEKEQADTMKFQNPPEGGSADPDLNAKIEYKHKGILKLLEEDHKFKLFCIDAKMGEEKIDMRSMLEYLRHPGKFRCEVSFRMKVIPLEV